MSTKKHANEFGEIVDTIIKTDPFRRITYKRGKCFCYIDQINDYVFIYPPALLLLRHKRRSRRIHDD
jgi:hypothetical protein